MDQYSSSWHLWTEGVVLVSALVSGGTYLRTLGRRRSWEIECYFGILVREINSLQCQNTLCFMMALFLPKVAEITVRWRRIYLDGSSHVIRLCTGIVMFTINFGTNSKDKTLLNRKVRPFSLTNSLNVFNRLWVF